MKVSFLGHACLEIDNNHCSLIIDPYLNGSSWAGQLDILDVHPDWRARLNNAECVIFSHAHDDHFNERFITENINLFARKKIIIPNFIHKFFIKRLREIGFSDVYEVDDKGYIYNGLYLKVLINNSDMDSSWLIRDENGNSILCQTDNIDIEQVASVDEVVDILFFMFNTTGIFPLFLDTTLDIKLRLLNEKRIGWYNQIRYLIKRLNVTEAYGYASDLYYSKDIEKNLYELLVPFPKDLKKIAPGTEINLSTAERFLILINEENRINRLSSAINRDREAREQYDRQLSELVQVSNQEQLRAYLLLFINELQRVCSRLDGRVRGNIKLISPILRDNIEHNFLCGVGYESNNYLEIKICIPAGVFLKLVTKKLEMGAISLWNGGMTYWREDPTLMTNIERQFWRSFRRMQFYE